MLNTYTLAVYKKQGKPCFVVTIEHIFHSATLFFNTMDEALDYIHEEKTSLAWTGHTLQYDETCDISEGALNVIRTVLICDKIKIGKHGRTYLED